MGDTDITRDKSYWYCIDKDTETLEVGRSFVVSECEMENLHFILYPARKEEFEMISGENGIMLGIFYDYFVGRVAKIAEKYGKTPIGWDPIDTSPEINSSVILQNWKDSNEEAVKKNMKIIVSIAGKTYLDMKYNKETPYGLDWAGYIPVDVAYKWDPTDYAPKNLVLGLEAPLWTETISTQDQMYYMIYPRLPGYAEIGWTAKANRNWDEYKVRLASQEKRLTVEGVNYYKWTEL